VVLHKTLPHITVSLTGMVRQGQCFLGGTTAAAAVAAHAEQSNTNE